MNHDIDLLMELIRRAMFLVLLLSAPILVAGLVVGLVVSLIQAVTQVQEQSLAFIPKIAAMVIAAVVTLPWIGGHLIEFTQELLTLAMTP
jgi:flagellar biosynthetic protein FliQ